MESRRKSHESRGSRHSERRSGDSKSRSPTRRAQREGVGERERPRSNYERKDRDESDRRRYKRPMHRATRERDLYERPSMFGEDFDLNNESLWVEKSGEAEYSHGLPEERGTADEEIIGKKRDVIASPEDLRRDSSNDRRRSSLDEQSANLAVTDDQDIVNFIAPQLAQGNPATPEAASASELNKLKSRALKARMMRAPNADELERQYKEALDRASSPSARGQAGGPDANSEGKRVVILPQLDSRGRPLELASVTKQTGELGAGLPSLTKGLARINRRLAKKGRSAAVEEAEDAGVVALARMERATRDDAADGDRLFAKRIMRDERFNPEDVDYLDDNAERYTQPRRVKTNEERRREAIEGYKRMQRSIEDCYYCFQQREGRDGEVSASPPRLPVIALGTRVYLGLPYHEVMCDGHCVIAPIEHIPGSCLNCDEDTLTEIRNFMKCLYLMFDAKGQVPVFMETVTTVNPVRARHCSIECVPVPREYFDDVPISFQQGLLNADEEWSQHRKIIDTEVKRRAVTKRLTSADGGAVRDMTSTAAGDGTVTTTRTEVTGGFLHTMTPKLPYFHVWFNPDGGMGHIIENPDLFPPWFGREILAGILDLPPTVYRKPKQLRESKEKRFERADEWKRQFEWEKYDWTKAL